MNCAAAVIRNNFLGKLRLARESCREGKGWRVVGDLTMRNENLRMGGVRFKVAYIWSKASDSNLPNDAKTNQLCSV